MKNENVILSDDRQKVLEKIEEYEKIGGEAFFNDVENDPPSSTLMPDDVDYLYTKLVNKIKRTAAQFIESIVGPMIVRSHKTELVGKENLAGIDSGAIITANHFNRFENLGAKMVCKAMPGHRKFYRVIREGNYFIPGIIGFLLKYCNTLPISSNHKTMVNLGKAIEKVLANGDCVLIYPEQSMWYNYKKPRMYRAGAFYYAAKNNVPIVPCFTTLSNLPGYDKDGYPKVKYTVHIMPPIYPSSDLSVHENTQIMMEKNLKLCREKYEEVYGERPVYLCGEL